jgi:ribosome-binding ATPase YchF (GTP1/OBG family)
MLIITKIFSNMFVGNAFLSNIRAVDGIFHLTRAFDDADIVHVEGDINPVRDLEIIHEELRLKVGFEDRKCDMGG